MKVGPCMNTPGFPLEIVWATSCVVKVAAIVMYPPVRALPMHMMSGGTPACSENGVHTGYRVAYRHGIPCVAVIPRPYGDEIAFRGLSAGVPILYSHFHGDFDRYGTRIAIKYVLHGRGYDLQKQFSEVDRRLVGEPTEHDVRHFF